MSLVPVVRDPITNLNRPLAEGDILFHLGAIKNEFYSKSPEYQEVFEMWREVTQKLCALESNYDCSCCEE